MLKTNSVCIQQKTKYSVALSTGFDDSTNDNKH